MSIIVNLSCLQRPIAQTHLGFGQIPSKGFAAFVKLCDIFETSAHFSFFTKLTNPAWVAYQYQTQLQNLIQAYKLGHHDTKSFLQTLRQIFSFINDEGLRDPKVVPLTVEIREQRDHYLCLKDKPFLKDEDYIYAFLEQAWNAIIEVDEKDALAFEQMAMIATQDNPIYLISNTNELNIHAWQDKIHSLLGKPELPLAAMEVQGLKMIQLDPDKPIFLVPSYLNYQFKAAASTPGLLQTLIESQQLTPSKVEVVSQHQADLDLAQKLDIPPVQCHSPDAFFQRFALENEASNQRPSKRLKKFG